MTNYEPEAERGWEQAKKQKKHKGELGTEWERAWWREAGGREGEAAEGGGRGNIT